MPPIFGSTPTPAPLTRRTCDGGSLAAYVSTKLATLDDGTLEMECDALWRASPDFVVKLIEGKWTNIN